MLRVVRNDVIRELSFLVCIEFCSLLHGESGDQLDVSCGSAPIAEMWSD